ncbi:MAG TPA: response regulator transcription factor [Prolixibacteraceae bacterium]|nr:response regulator transcription factor [Prolixibacteraceae bacterium]
MKDQKVKILVVDDEKDLCEILQFNLESEGYEVETAYSAEEALKKPLESFDLILLDVMMGGMSGFKAADTIRKQKQLDIPIIFITAKSGENDMLTGFNLGADDYIQKPFSVKEVTARVKAVLKRGRAQVIEKVSYLGLEIDPGKKLAFIDGQVIDLTRKEFDILHLLMRRKGSYISRDEILDKVWNDDVIVTERNVDVNIARLRKKIGSYGNNIKGKTGYGYLFEE